MDATTLKSPNILVRRIGEARLPLFESILLHVQLVLGGLLGMSPLILDPATGAEGPFSTIASPLRTGGTILIIALAYVSGARIPLRSTYWVGVVYCLYLIATARISPDAGGTLRAAVDFSLVLLSLALVTAAMAPIAVANAMLNVLAGVVLLSALVAVLIPSIGITDIAGSWGGDAQVGSWRGILTEKNGLGCTACVAVYIMAICWKMWRAPAGFKYTGFVAALACLYMARSSNAAGGLVAMGAADLILRGNVTRGRATLTWALAIPAVAALTISSFMETVFIALGRDPTASNRTLIWAYALNVWQMSPWFGHGFVEGTLIVLQPGLVTVFGPAARHAHSGYIEALVDTGLIGLFLLSIFLLLALIAASARPASGEPSRNVAARVYQAVIVGALAMATADVFTFRLFGGFGVITWCAVLAAPTLPVAAARSARARAGRLYRAEPGRA